MSDLILSKVPKSKEEQLIMATSLISNVLDGNVNPIQAVVQAKSLAETLKLFLDDKQVNQTVLNEVEKFGKSCDQFGATVAIKEVGTKWDYSECGDMIYNELVNQKKEIDNQIKSREVLLKATKNKRTEVNEETGEIYTILPPSKSSTTSYSITFKKCIE